MSDQKAIVPPKGDYIQLDNPEEYAEKLKEWGLPASKSEYWYKDRKQQYAVQIKGYEVYGEDHSGNTIVIEFEDGSLGCIHPAFLKEMQAGSFGKIYLSDAGEAVPVKQEKTEPKSAPAKKTAPKKESKKEQKESPKKVVLPDDKVHFTAKVKQFALSWNHFNEENDEVVVLENVTIQQDENIEIGLAWCSHSKTLKKWELTPGDQLEFDGKIVKKKLPQGKDAEEEFLMEEAVPYKINNPSKIQKS
ncbi:hypothetical protein [Cytobacillus gottheilii]|uniref:hypothetical protein n=1 Tax=Cytobacillus gottheilii TaxID=859144 RepID=UPI001118C6A1|nr:hypothetical protein [Cytobacillus gottheilii]